LTRRASRAFNEKPTACITQASAFFMRNVWHYNSPTLFYLPAMQFEIHLLRPPFQR